MSTPSVNSNRPPAAVPPAGGGGTSGEPQGRQTTIVSSNHRDSSPDPAAASQMTAWKLGNATTKENPILRTMPQYANAARLMAQQSGSNARSRPSNVGKFQALKKVLLGAFKGSRPEAVSKEQRLTAISENSRVITSDAEASILIGQAASLQQSTDVIPQARALLQKSGNREELSDYFRQNIRNVTAGRTQSRHFRNISTALIAAGAIAGTENAGQRIIKAAHPEMDPARQARLAKHIDLGAMILGRLQDARYVPERQQLQQLVEKQNINSFGDPNQTINPYLILADRDNFSDTDDVHIRGALLDALQLVEDASQLITDSVLGEESTMNPDQLIRQAERCGIKINTRKETTLANEVQTDTSFQLADSPQPAGKKLETDV